MRGAFTSNHSRYLSTCCLCNDSSLLAGFTATMNNPYDSADAIQHSCYVRYDPTARHHHHVMAHTGDPLKWTLALHVHEQLRALILNPAFPCILGRSALKNNAYRFGFYSDACSDSSMQGLCRDLWSFATEQRTTFAGDFSTFVASFESRHVTNELDFEALLCQVLQSLNDRDAAVHTWDPATSSDPDNPQFSFSFAGRSFFLVGLNPHSPRFSRKFPYPTLVFNSHEQFERLRVEGRFDRVQATIRDRDIMLQGNINPNLSNYGDASEAKQYSGRQVEDDWRCPFKAKQNEQP